VQTLTTDPTLITIGSEQPVEQSLPQAIERIVRELQPEKIILFGSYAYGDPTPDSDVDLLVIMETDAPRRERYLAVSRLLVPRPFPVDILVKTPLEIQQAFQRNDFFIKEIVTQGRVLYEQHN
jgi:predicted nucleotidyltransferase